MNASRRQFLADVGKGMLVAGVGSSVAFDLGLAAPLAEESGDRLTFGSLDPLVNLMQDTPAKSLLPVLVREIRSGTSLKTLVAAGALANARTFGGQDYTGYHAFMALPPALSMADEMPEKAKALPVLKVLYRNTARMQAHGGAKNEVLHPIVREVATERNGDALLIATRTADMTKAEKAFAQIKDDAAFDALQAAIQDEVDVHRVVLAWRARTMLDITGAEHAHTLLRQSVRFCVAAEKSRIDRRQGTPLIRVLLPKLFDEHKLAGRTPGSKVMGDDAVSKLAEVFYGTNRGAAAEAAAMALAEGFSLDSVGEAMTLASTRLVLNDPGRAKDEEGKPKGSVHGASVGVHASDSANAWRNIAKAGNARNAFASLIVGAFHTAGQSHGQKPFEPVKTAVANRQFLIPAIGWAIQQKNQAEACRSTALYCMNGYEIDRLFSLMLPYAVSEDGALHAEKYYRTVREEVARSRKAFVKEHLMALARVTASENGFPAPGYAEAKTLLET